MYKQPDESHDYVADVQKGTWSVILTSGLYFIFVVKNLNFETDLGGAAWVAPGRLAWGWKESPRP